MYTLVRIIARIPVVARCKRYVLLAVIYRLPSSGILTGGSQPDTASYGVAVIQGNTKDVSAPIHFLKYHVVFHNKFLSSCREVYRHAVAAGYLYSLTVIIGVIVGCSRPVLMTKAAWCKLHTHYLGIKSGYGNSLFLIIQPDISIAVLAYCYIYRIGLVGVKLKRHGLSGVILISRRQILGRSREGMRNIYLCTVGNGERRIFLCLTRFLTLGNFYITEVVAGVNCTFLTVKKSRIDRNVGRCVSLAGSRLIFRLCYLIIIFACLKLNSCMTGSVSRKSSRADRYRSIRHR